jgi:hypothetical protein
MRTVPSETETPPVQDHKSDWRPPLKLSFRLDEADALTSTTLSVEDRDELVIFFVPARQHRGVMIAVVGSTGFDEA